MIKRLNIIQRTIALIWQSSPRLNVYKFSLVAINAILPLASLYMIKLIVDEVALIINQMPNSNTKTIVILIAIWIGINFVNTIVNILVRFVNETHQQKLTNHIQEIIHQKSSDLDYSFYENPEYQDTFHRAQKEGIARPGKMIVSISDILQHSAVLAGLLLLLFSLHWSTILVLIVAQLPVGIVQIKYANKKHTWESKRTVLNRKSKYLNQLLTDIPFAKEIRIFNFATYFKVSYNKLRDKLYIEKFKINSIEAKMKLIAAISELIGIAIVFYFIVSQSVLGILSIGSLVMYIQGYQKGQIAARGIFKGLVGVYEHKLFLVHFFNFTDMESIIRSDESLLELPDNSELKIELSNINFKYPLCDQYVLEDVNLDFNYGQITAIVGENGSGKSSLVKLLTRLYDPTSGSITINKTDIKRIDLVKLRSNISNVFQDYSKYSLSLKQNITGRDDIESIDLQSALKRADLENVISKLPKGINSWLGRQFNNGAELSGGEWQRIALARAFYKKARVLILDEPTTHIDGTHESAFLSSLKEIKKDKIIILISHKLSNIAIADHIIVFKEGKIIGQGNYETLATTSSYFRSLFNIE